MPAYSPECGWDFVESTTAQVSELAHRGTQELLNLSDDLLLARSNFHAVPADAVRGERWEFDNRGWLFLHFRLDGLSEDETPDGRRRMLGRQSFFLSASTQRPSFARELLGDSWRTVAIACRPSFFMRDLQVSGEDLPAELRRFQAGDPDIDFWHAGQLTNDMKSVVTALLYPAIHAGVRPIYLRAKVVELMCLAVDRLRKPESPAVQPLKLSQRDVTCLQAARRLLRDRSATPSLEQLARYAGLNRTKLAMGFKRVFGVTVGEYHRELRLELARKMLEEPGVRIGRVAAIAGYSDAGSFSKAFKLRYGCLPSELTSDQTVSRLATTQKLRKPETD
ncbi:MAG: helix-turn-helix domain-containing protein [Steroidobacteraceae bacterium]